MRPFSQQNPGIGIGGNPGTGCGKASDAYRYLRSGSEPNMGSARRNCCLSCVPATLSVAAGKSHFFFSKGNGLSAALLAYFHYAVVCASRIRAVRSKAASSSPISAMPVAMTAARHRARSRRQWLRRGGGALNWAARKVGPEVGGDDNVLSLEQSQLIEQGVASGTEGPERTRRGVDAAAKLMPAVDAAVRRCARLPLGPSKRLRRDAHCVAPRPNRLIFAVADFLAADWRNT